MFGKGKAAPAKKDFSRDQVAADTERSLRGRPQLHGAADMEDMDDAPEAGGLAPEAGAPPMKGAAAPPPAMAGGAPPAAPAAPGEKPFVATQDEAVQPPPTVESLQAENADLKARVEALEQHLGIGAQPEDTMDDGEGFGGGAHHIGK